MSYKFSPNIPTFIFLLLFCFNLQAQKVKTLNSAEIYTAIEKLNFLGSVLYIAAHPDDENTRLISYLSNDVKARTAYLSLTRGDGGQNLIGTEIQDLLGVLRTQELLMARSVDGGEQFFSRAIDFGYSKHPDETLKIWNKDEVMSDVVRVIRQFQPDVIINRFDHRSPGKTHGHHTASAMLSVESYDLTGNENIYPEQLETLSPWTPSRQFFNTSWWFYGSREKFAEADKSNLMSMDIGVYYPLLSKSNTEIAADARSMHKCQGFGSAGTRGSYTEYIELIHGEMPENKESIFEGIDTSWSRLEGGEAIGVLLAQVLENFDFTHPAASIPSLMEVYKMINDLDSGTWKEKKIKEVKTIIAACAGLYLEVSSDLPKVTYGDSIELTYEFINRSDASITLNQIRTNPEIQIEINKTLENNQSYEEFRSIEITKETPKSQHYWLNEKHEMGMFTVSDKAFIGKPESDPSMIAEFDMIIEGIPITFNRNIVYKYVDPSIGEIYQPFEVYEPVFVGIDEDVIVFTDNGSKDIKVTVKSGTDEVKGSVNLKMPKGWKSAPSNYDFDIVGRSNFKQFTFTVSPPETQSSANIKPIVSFKGQNYSSDVIEIKYDHIPLQTVVMDESTKVVKIDMKKAGKKIGYIEGAGDKVAECISYMGYQVEEIDVAAVGNTDLSSYDAIVLGIRALNTNENIEFALKPLHEYIKAGGTMVVQYNTTRRLKAQDFGPYPIELSRFRVSDENAEVRIINPDHAVMSTPNKITSADFDDWIQERGLYFPKEWDEKYEAILSSNDVGEEPGEGSLLVVQYGEGHFVYSSLSWFRQLPAGNPGAYRIFANLLSLGNE